MLYTLLRGSLSNKSFTFFHKKGVLFVPLIFCIYFRSIVLWEVGSDVFVRLSVLYFLNNSRRSVILFC